MQSLDSKFKPMDLCGNVKIPRIEAFNSYQADDDGWISSANVNTVESYSSLIGLPIVGIDWFKKEKLRFLSKHHVSIWLVRHSTPFQSTIMEPVRVLNVTCLDCVTDDYFTYYPEFQKSRMNSFLGLPQSGFNRSEKHSPALTDARTMKFLSSQGTEYQTFDCAVT